MSLPLLISPDPDRPVLWSEGRARSVAELMRQATAVAKQFGAGHQLLNLCERRDAFIVSFCAALLRGHANVLPPSRAQSVVAEVAASTPGCYRSDDASVRRAVEEAGEVLSAGQIADLCNLRLLQDHIAATAFTSGSTGAPQRHIKLWSSFTATSRLNAGRIREALAESGHTARPYIVATVPPQHMYGLETSVLLPLLADMAVHAARPLFPADIAAALAEMPEPRVLVTTPFHLRAIVASGQRFAAIQLVVSATAPLDAALARAVEERLATSVLEMFGSTETCVIATRRTSQEEAWRLYPQVTLEPGPSTTRVEAPWLSQPVFLQDVLELRSDDRFTVLSRNADMVEVAGKRASLAQLTQRVLSVPGVRDAVVFQPDAPAAGSIRRVAALVVAPGLSAERICEALASSVDPAFMPRPLLLVDALPRNEVGKLPRAHLLVALHESAKSGRAK